MSKTYIIKPIEFAKIATPNLKQVLEAVIKDDQVLRATKYISPKEVIRVVRTSYRFNGRKTRKDSNVQMTMTIGRPNYLEREFIELCQKAKEPFPIKKIQLKFVSSKKKPLKKKK